MPIKGLTTETTPGAGLPIIARLYKGGPMRPHPSRQGVMIMGEDLDYFRVEFEDAFQQFAPVWRELYGDKPESFSPVFLAAPTVDEAFVSWKEEWRKIGSGAAMIHRCDGENQVLWYDTKDNIYVRSLTPCLGTCDCKPVGRLSLVVPEFIEATGVLGYISVTTHSVNDILTVYKYLSDIERLYGKINGVPFVFGRADRQMSAPKTDREGNRTGRLSVTKSLFYLFATPEFTQQQILPAMAAAPALTEPQPVDVEKSRSLLGNGDRPRRLGAPESQPVEPPEPVFPSDEFLLAQPALNPFASAPRPDAGGK